MRHLPNIRIYTPSDEHELDACFEEATRAKGPSYIRICKSDRHAVHSGAIPSTEPILVNEGTKASCLVSMGSMSAISQSAAREFGLSHLVFPRVKPFPMDSLRTLASFEHLVVVEEHSRFGGLCSSLLDAFCESGLRAPRMTSLSLQEKFAEKCGSYQYALSEHAMDDVSIMSRVRQAVEGPR